MMSKGNANGVLYLLPVWLGESGGTELLPPANIAIAERVKLFFCENERTARRMLRRMSATLDLNAIGNVAFERGAFATFGDDLIAGFLRRFQIAIRGKDARAFPRHQDGAGAPIAHSTFAGSCATHQRDLVGESPGATSRGIDRHHLPPEIVRFAAST